MTTLIVFDRQDSSRRREIEGSAAAVNYSPGRDHVGSARHTAYYAALDAAGFEPDARGERYAVMEIETA